MSLMETLHFDFPADIPALRRARVGVVSSGDLEVLLFPDTGNTGAQALVRVRTSVDGFAELWQAALYRFFDRHPVAGRYELNDFGATPGVVALRLLQAIEASCS